ncbi:MAG: glycosyltransferase family 39 protein [Verrucomicrobiae bacterium]|nr:glycosyltransferase family 39 protein [Verrucomicrobiae bacterium]
MLLWALACGGGIWIRPLLPLDETRYTAVAWEMHRDAQWLVPRLNGEAYHHKPPLLFWLMQAGWTAFGPAEIWARLVAPLFGLAAIVLTWRMARMLWPERNGAAFLAPILLAASGLFAMFSSLVFFDLPLTACVLVAWLGILDASAGRPVRGWLQAGIAIGAGILFKGPVAMLHAGLPALLAPVWMRHRRPSPSWPRWYAGLLCALLAGAVLALAWAIPAARAGGPEFERMLFFGQHAGRIVGSFQNDKPVLWYLSVLPPMLLQ